MMNSFSIGVNYRRSFLYCKGICKRIHTKPVILGIESSCDDTGGAIVDGNGKILAEHLISQRDVVLRHGGVIPVIARHLHKSHIHTVVQRTLIEANMTVNDLNAIAVTVKPGLAMSISVGLEYAKELCSRFKKSLIPIHHMEAHALTVRLFDKDVKYPYLTCLISGGHCLLGVVHSVDEFSLLGQSIDDAPGEVFDKVARRLKAHNFPQHSVSSGGAVIEDLAKSGNPLAFSFTIPLQHYKNCNFSFSGMKSQAMRYIETEERKFEIEADEILQSASDLCASFQWSVTKHLCRRLQRAMEYVERNNLLPRENLSLVVSGGVACNKYILTAFETVCHEYGYNLRVPPPKYCTDNGAMIAWNGVERYLSNIGIYESEEIENIKMEPSVCKLQ